MVKSSSLRSRQRATHPQNACGLQNDSLRIVHVIWRKLDDELPDVMEAISIVKFNVRGIESSLMAFVYLYRHYFRQEDSWRVSFSCCPEFNCALGAMADSESQPTLGGQDEDHRELSAVKSELENKIASFCIKELLPDRYSEFCECFLDGSIVSLEDFYDLLEKYCYRK